MAFHDLCFLLVLYCVCIFDIIQLLKPECQLVYQNLCKKNTKPFNNRLWYD